MASFELPPIGLVDFPRADDGYWEFELSFDGDAVRVDFNADGAELKKHAFDTVKQFVANASAFDAAARKAIRADFDADAEGSSALYLSHHAEEFTSEQRLEYFGAEDPGTLGVEHLLKSLRLQRIGLYPESEDYVAVFDYSVDEEATQYILAVEFDAAGTVVGISMDS